MAVVLWTGSSGQTCGDLLFRLSKYELPQSQAMIAASAHAPGSLGNYDDCGLLEGTRFVTLMLVTQDFSLSTSLLGLCIPSVCGVSDTDALAGYVRNTTRLAPGELVRFASVTFPEPAVMSNGGWALLAVTATLALVVLVVSCVEWVRGCKRDKMHLFWSVTWQQQAPETAQKEYAVLEDLSTDALPAPAAHVVEAAAKSSVVMIKIVQSFSLDRNLASLWTKEDASFEFFNGLRFFSMAWVMLGHGEALFAVISQNSDFFERYIHRSWLNQVSFSFTYSVDAFFFMGGFLVALSLLKSFKRGGFNLALFYIHRVLRLTPVFLYWVLFRWLVMPYLSSGPLWSASTLAAYCNNWWVEVLYIQPFWVLAGGSGAQCVSQDWYLSTDMHLYLLSPLFVFLLWKVPRAGLAVVLTCTGLSLVYTIAIQYVTTRMYEPLVYFPFWARFPEYAIGIVVAYLLLTRGFASRVGDLLRWSMYAVAGSVLVMLLFVTLGTVDPHSTRSWFIFNGIDHFLWTLGIGVVSFFFLLGYGGWVNAFLSWSVFRPLARLTYGAYLVHVGVIQYLIFSQQSFVFFSGATWVQFYLFVIIVSYTLSLLSYLDYRASFL